MVCCFFGHHDTSASVNADLLECIENIIKEGKADYFLVGNHGSFDSMVRYALRSLKDKYPHIRYNVVLAYMPGQKDEYSQDEKYQLETLYPEGLETVPKRFAISWRNDWMLKLSDIVVCYVRHSMGGSGKFVEKAIRQKKQVINLAEPFNINKTEDTQ